MEVGVGMLFEGVEGACYVENINKDLFDLHIYCLDDFGYHAIFSS